eukprot:4036650-Alexandrium_andersonii.AAC.1
MSTVHKVYARTRLRQVEGWAKQRGDPDLFAGVKGRGAADAWTRTAIAAEDAEGTREHMATTTVD